MMNRIRYNFIGLSLLLGALVIGSGCAPSVIEIKTFSSTDVALAKLRTGEVDAVVGDFVVMSYGARESAGALTMAGPQFDRQPIGIGVAKEASFLKDAVAAALIELMQNKTYINSLLTWNVSGAKTAPPVAPAEVLPSEEIIQLKDGILKVGMELGYPPMEFFDELKEPAGVDVEIANALGAQLGVEVELVDMPFDALVDALQTGKVDIVMSTMAITPEREEVIDFVQYLSMGSGIMVASGNPKNIMTLESLCGNRVGAQDAMAQLETIRAIECK